MTSNERLTCCTSGIYIILIYEFIIYICSQLHTTIHHRFVGSPRAKQRLQVLFEGTVLHTTHLEVQVSLRCRQGLAQVCLVPLSHVVFGEATECFGIVLILLGCAPLQSTQGVDLLYFVRCVGVTVGLEALLTISPLIESFVGAIVVWVILAVCKKVLLGQYESRQVSRVLRG